MSEGESAEVIATRAGAAPCGPYLFLCESFPKARFTESYTAPLYPRMASGRYG
jgi:hypothetical protein